MKPMQVAAAVLIIPEEFDRLQEHNRFLAAIQPGMADSEGGRLLDNEKVTKILDAEFNS